MRLFAILFCFLLPLFGNTVALATTNAERNAPALSQTFLESSRSKVRFLDKISGKIAQKRLQKVTKGNGKGLALTGLALGVLGSVFVILGFQMDVFSLIIVALLLSLAGLLISQIGLDHANAADFPNRWTKAMAYTGLGLNLLVFLISGGFSLLILFFGKKG